LLFGFPKLALIYRSGHPIALISVKFCATYQMAIGAVRISRIARREDPPPTGRQGPKAGPEETAPVTTPISPQELKSWLRDGRELALFDAREHGLYGLGHLLFAVPLPYSRLEARLAALAPCRSVRLVLVDGGEAEGPAAKAAVRAEALGYEAVHVLAGGTAAWQAAGHQLFAGVNVPSKTFGELAEHHHQTPSITAAALKARQDHGDALVILDGRPVAEYRKMTIPGSHCCPNGELAYRAQAMIPDPAATVVVNCAGRTRSIIGAQTLRELGIPNPVFALENGTQGWQLAGFELEHGAQRLYPSAPQGAAAESLRVKGHDLAAVHQVPLVGTAEVNRWLGEAARTTYLLDVRTAEEFAAGHGPGAVHAPGGQLVQATDHWVGVRGARLVLLDHVRIRAVMSARWLRALGHDAAVLEGDSEAWRHLVPPRREQSAERGLPALAAIDAELLVAKRSQADAPLLVDCRHSDAYGAAHGEGAVWMIRPTAAAALKAARWRPGQGVVLIADDETVARSLALDLSELGVADLGLLVGGLASWRAAGGPVVATPEIPVEAERIDHLSFVHDRHAGNLEAARRYLEWEIGLVGQLDADERASFRLG
jgi:rhodanese-related sulfurtransferase